MVNKELEIHTVIVDGDFKSFKAALSRSVLGVTFRKFKRRRSEFYQHRVHNDAVVQLVEKRLYEYLLTQTNLRNISDLKLKTDMTIEWEENGKIEAFKNIAVRVYMMVGELIIENLKFQKDMETVSIDLFYSEIDASSQKLRSLLPTLLESVGKDSFVYKEFDFLTDQGRKMASAYGVEKVPSVVINAESPPIENPDERKLRQEIERAFSPKLITTKPEFSLEPIKKPVAELLAKASPVTFESANQ
jgi:hypothetical protein